jgi:hypothetical protein
MKTLEKTSDGRIIVRQKEQAKPYIHLPDNFLMIEAYGERCISGFNDNEVFTNLYTIVQYVGPDNPLRKKYDPVVIGSFTPVITTSSNTNKHG